jgi:membrane-associated protein
LETSELLDWISQYGYFALFFFLWLGIVGMPIPDEVVVMTGGMVSSLQILQTVPSFLLTYLGVISGLSIGYGIGRIWGANVYNKLGKKNKYQKYLNRSEQLLTKYGSFALCISYFLPIVRHVLPYLAGSYQMPFIKYSLFSYTTGLVWTAIYFYIGYQFGDSIDFIAKFSRDGGYILLLTIIVILFAFQIFRALSRRRKSNRGDKNDSAQNDPTSY